MPSRSGVAVMRHPFHRAAAFMRSRRVGMPVVGARPHHGRMTTAGACAHCGGGEFASPLTSTVRGVSFAFCSLRCREEHLVALEVAPPGCLVPGCDTDAVADLPLCTAHAA